MKHLDDFKEEIHKCSKCGLCQAVCPLYAVTGNECTVSRGQFIMLDGVIKKHLKMNKNINKYLDLCLKCGKCTDFCPSEIDIVQILLSAKYEYFKRSLFGKIYGILESKVVFDNLLKVIQFASGLFSKKIQSKSFDKKVVWFGGCVEKFNPHIRNYVVELLNRLGLEPLDIDFNCCGMPFLTTGNLDRFRAQAIENIKKIPDDIEYIVCDCSSCEWALKQYVKYIDDEDLKQKMMKIKFKNIYDLISEGDIKFVCKNHKTVTYHKPCHQEGIDSVVKILENCDGVGYTEMSGYDECCAFSSFEVPSTIFKLKPLMKKKFENMKKTNADYVLTSCVGCVASLGIISRFSKKVRRLISFLKDECEIKD
jgi:glycolate oxidase iron-sulfur subunit